jgi:hypothetical protein
MSELPHRAAAPLLVIMRDALFDPLCLYSPSVALGHMSCALLVPPFAPLRVGRKSLLLCGGLLGMLLVGGELPPSPLVSGTRPMLVGARLLILLL